MYEYNCKLVKVVDGDTEHPDVARRINSKQRVLTKVVDNNQIVCSLNDGIIIVMRLYDNLVRAEQIVGVSGWDEATTERIRTSIETNENNTPSSIVQYVQSELERLKEGGMNPRTPTMPKRRENM